MPISCSHWSVRERKRIKDILIGTLVLYKHIACHAQSITGLETITDECVIQEEHASTGGNITSKRFYNT